MTLLKRKKKVLSNFSYLIPHRFPVKLYAKKKSINQIIDSI